MKKTAAKNETRMVQAILRLPKRYLDMAKEMGRKEYTSYSAILRRAIIEWMDGQKGGGK
jgi:hypothetical protein